MSKKTHLNIDGMTCVNCQNKIERGLNSADGVLHATVSYAKGAADIEYDEGIISRKRIIEVIEDLDYQVILPGQSTSSDLVNIISMLVIIVALYVMLQSLGILNRLVPSRLADAGMEYGMLFVIGLITSVHCIAMCGGINLSQSLPKREGIDASDGSRLQPFIPSLSYNLGRVCSYTAVGFVLGFIGMFIGAGTGIGVSVFLQGILKIIAGLFMVILGINMLNLFPWLRKFTLRTPLFLARAVGAKRVKASRPFAIGLLNGLMPCGPLQSMWIVALATGNPFAGALSMFLFSLGTVPLMLGLGSIVSAIGKKFTDKVMTVGAILIIVLGLSMLAQGGSLSGLLTPELLLYMLIAFSVAGVVLSIPNRSRWVKYVAYTASLAVIIGTYVLWNFQRLPAKNKAGAENEVEIRNGVQIVSSTLAPGSYPNITVQAGIPVRWVVDAPEGSINGCNYRMLIREYGVEHTFQEGENVIEFIPEQEGTIRYSCWMGMIYGNIFVSGGTGTVAADEAVEEAKVAFTGNLPCGDC